MSTGQVVRVDAAVLVSAAAARLLAVAVRRYEADQHRQARRLAPELAAVVADLEAAAGGKGCERVEHAAGERIRAAAGPAVVSSPRDPHRPLRTDEVAELLGCSPQAVRERARRGTLPGHLDAGRWLFDRAALDPYRGR